jgi:hypothetical protein
MKILKVYSRTRFGDVSYLFKINDRIPDKEIVNDFGRTIHTFIDSDCFELSGHAVTRYELLDGVPPEALMYGNIVHTSSDTFEILLRQLRHMNIAKT